FRDAAVDPVTGTERRTSGFQGTLINPYYLYPRQFFLDTRDRLLGTATLRYEVTDWLYAQGRINYDFGHSHNERNNPTGWGTSNPLNNDRTGFNGDYNTDMSTGTELNADFLVGASKE